MLNELHSLYEKDAVHAVHHVPRGAKVLPMKAVATQTCDKFAVEGGKISSVCMWKFST